MTGTRLLYIGGLCSFAAAALHLACIAGGPAWYRALGAGERMADLAAAGHWYPPTSALVIAVVLATWIWIATSSLCVAFGLLYALGLRLAWPRLSVRA